MSSLPNEVPTEPKALDLEIVPTKFVSVNACYRHTGNRVYLTQDGRKFKAEVRDCILSHIPDGWPTAEAVRVEMTLQFPDRRRRDIDNYNKLLFDACNGLLWCDDCQIVELSIKKIYCKDAPLIKMRIEEV